MATFDGVTGRERDFGHSASRDLPSCSASFIQHETAECSPIIAVKIEDLM